RPSHSPLRSPPSAASRWHPFFESFEGNASSHDALSSVSQNRRSTVPEHHMEAPDGGAPMSYRFLILALLEVALIVAGSSSTAAGSPSAANPVGVLTAANTGL